MARLCVPVPPSSGSPVSDSLLHQRCPVRESTDGVQRGYRPCPPPVGVSVTRGGDPFVRVIQLCGQSYLPIGIHIRHTGPRWWLRRRVRSISESVEGTDTGDFRLFDWGQLVLAALIFGSAFLWMSLWPPIDRSGNHRFRAGCTGRRRSRDAFKAQRSVAGRPAAAHIRGIFPGWLLRPVVRTCRRTNTFSASGDADQRHSDLRCRPGRHGYTDLA